MWQRELFFLGEGGPGGWGGQARFADYFLFVFEGKYKYIRFFTWLFIGFYCTKIKLTKDHHQL
jgi:hypothetical protein